MREQRLVICHWSFVIVPDPRAHTGTPALRAEMTNDQIPNDQWSGRRCVSEDWSFVIGHLSLSLTPEPTRALKRGANQRVRDRATCGMGLEFAQASRRALGPRGKAWGRHVPLPATLPTRHLADSLIR